MFFRKRRGGQENRERPQRGQSQLSLSLSHSRSTSSDSQEFLNLRLYPGPEDGHWVTFQRLLLPQIRDTHQHLVYTRRNPRWLTRLFLFSHRGIPHSRPSPPLKLSNTFQMFFYFQPATYGLWDWPDRAKAGLSLSQLAAGMATICGNEDSTSVKQAPSPERNPWSQLRALLPPSTKCSLMPDISLQPKDQHPGQFIQSTDPIPCFSYVF